MGRGLCTPDWCSGGTLLQYWDGTTLHSVQRGKAREHQTPARRAETVLQTSVVSSLEKPETMESPKVYLHASQHLHNYSYSDNGHLGPSTENGQTPKSDSELKERREELKRDSATEGRTLPNDDRGRGNANDEGTTQYRSGIRTSPKTFATSSYSRRVL